MDYSIPMNVVRHRCFSGLRSGSKDSTWEPLWESIKELAVKREQGGQPLTYPRRGQRAARSRREERDQVKEI
jgi:hypothetical protein